jgi:hypothetical protein
MQCAWVDVRTVRQLGCIGTQARPSKSFEWQAMTQAEWQVLARASW